MTEIVGVAFLVELEKIAEYAPGLPNKKKTSPIPAVGKPTNWELVLQHHPAVRAGDHTDVRLVNPATGIAHSWATKKEWPAPGERVRLYQQPDHTADYARHFRGHILGPYGKTRAGTKGVEKKLHEKVEVLEANDKLVRFNVYQGKGPQEYVLARNAKSQGAPAWTLLNVTQTRERLGDLPFSKPPYREIKPHEVAFENDAQVMAAKLDGAHNTFLLVAGKRPRIFSYREPKERATGAIEHSHKVEALYHTRVPAEVGGKGGTILRGELYAKNERGPVAPETVGGMVNASVWKSRELQKEHGALRPAVFDVVKYLGEDQSQKGYGERLAVLRAIQKHVPGLEIPDVAEDATTKRALFKAIQGKTHPGTHEGVILWDRAVPAPPTKVKFKGEHDVYVRGIERAVDVHGKPKGEMGALYYSRTPDGPVVGKVGTGFTRDQRQRILAGFKHYVGGVMRIEAQSEYKSGALGKPVFNGWHPDKQDEDFWTRTGENGT